MVDTGTMQQRTILCFGDSNTWGALPDGTGRRAALADRWPSVLDAALNDGALGRDRDWVVVAEGLNGRTTVFEDPIVPGRSGAAALDIVLESHEPLDLVIVMLGTNDTKNFFQVSADQIGLGAGRLLQIIAASTAGREEHAPPVLLVAPAPIAALDDDMGVHFAPADRAAAISRALAGVYREVAAEYGAAFFDAGTVTQVGGDGVHLDAPAHRALGEALAPVVRGVLVG